MELPQEWKKVEVVDHPAIKMSHVQLIYLDQYPQQLYPVSCLHLRTDRRTSP